MMITYSVISIVGDHNEEFALESFSIASWYKHVLGPSATTEVELCQSITFSWSIGVQVAESTVEWDCN